MILKSFISFSQVIKFFFISIILVGVIFHPTALPLLLDVWVLRFSLVK